MNAVAHNLSPTLEVTESFGAPPAYFYHFALDLRCRSRPEAPAFRHSWTPVRPERRSWNTVGRSVDGLSNPPDPKRAQGGLAETSLTPKIAQGGPPRRPRWRTGLQKCFRNCGICSPFGVPVATIKTVLPYTRFWGCGKLSFHTFFGYFVRTCSRDPF